MGTFLQNFLSVLLGLAVAMGIIILGITLNENWIEYDYSQFPFEHWQRVVNHASITPEVKDNFFLALLFSGGVGAVFGGLVTAIFVTNAKKAYAALVGFILFIIAYLDIIFTPGHPTWYEISVMPVLFFFSWLGGLLTDLVYRYFFKSKKKG